MAIKIILKKNVRGNEQMVLDELDLLQRLKHPHIVKFVDWFESRVRPRSFGARSLACDGLLMTPPSLSLGQILHRH